MLVESLFIDRKGEGEELKAPHHISTAATCDHMWYIPNTGNSSFVVAIYIWNTA